MYIHIQISRCCIPINTFRMDSGNVNKSEKVKNLQLRVTELEEEHRKLHLVRYF